MHELQPGVESPHKIRTREKKMKKKDWMNIIVVVSLILYIWGLFVIGRASLAATTKAPDVNQNWVNLVAAVTVVLSLNAGAYFGLPETRLFPRSIADPEAIRGWAAGIYFLALVAAFLIAANSKFPHETLTDMSSKIVGFIVGVATVYLGRD